MAAAGNGINITYEGTYASQMLLEPIFRSDDVMKNYTVYPNVKFKQNVLLAPGLNKIVMANGGCSATDNAGAGLSTSFSITDKQITVANCSVKMSQCWDTFYNEIIVESYKNGINMPNLTGTELSRVIADRVRLGLSQDVVRVMWGGDTALPDVTYSWTDGLFKLMNASIATTQVVDATSAAGTLSTVGGTIAATSADDLLTQVFDSAPSNLQQTPASEKRIFVTPNVYNAFYGALTLVGQAGAVDFGHSEAQSGVNYRRIHFRGVEIVPMYEWDTIFTDQNAAITDGSGAYAGTNFKNLAVYAAKDNLMIGTDVTSPENQFKMFYDDVTDNMYIRSYFKMGYQYGYDSLVNIAMLVQ